MADDEAGGVLPVFDPDAMAGPRRATFRPLDPPPIGEDGTPELPPLPPWLSAPAPDPLSAQLADSPPPSVGDAAVDLAPPVEPDTRLMDADELGGALEATLTTGGTLAALEQFEQQLRLRGMDEPTREELAPLVRRVQHMMFARDLESGERQRGITLIRDLRPANGA